MAAEQRGMVDVSGKSVVLRVARACGLIRLKPSTIELIRRGRVPKGDVATATAIAAANAAKETWRILPYCHPIPVEHVSTTLEYGEDWVKVCVEVKATAKTGVEMEALTGVSIALLNIWDMVKFAEKDERGQYPATRIEWIRVEEKRKDEPAQR